MSSTISRRNFAAMAVTAASAVALAGCSATGKPAATASAVSKSAVDKAMNTATTLTFWSWIPISEEAALFEKKYPKIKVNLVNVGNGEAEFTKIRTALKAGSGAPDVAQMGYQDMSSFRVTNELLDLAPYGASTLEKAFVPTVWDQVKTGSSVYGIPQDQGPMGLLYRKDIYAKAGVAAPKTWADYATAAKVIKQKTGSYISNFPSGEPGAILSLLWQAGAKPFTYSGGKDIKIDLTSAKANQVVSFWSDLVSADLVGVDPEYTNQWYAGLSSGKYAGWVSAAWAPLFLESIAKKTSGNWTAQALPQWQAGQNFSAELGGSVNTVLKSSKNPIAAYELAKFINSDPSSTTLLTSKQSLYPTTTATLNEASFADAKSDFFGGQQVNKLFAGISTTVNGKYDWLPYMSYVGSSFTDTVGKAISARTDLLPAVKAWQAQLVAYGKQQGFNVN